MKKGKCINRAGCMLAYRGEVVMAPEADFVCRECRKPLEPVSEEKPRLLIKVAIALLCVCLAAILLLGGGLIVSIKRLERSDPSTTEKEKPASAETPGASAQSSPGLVAPESGTPATSATIPGASAPVIAAPSLPAEAVSAADTQGAGVMRDPAPNLDPANQSNQTTKAEVLKRIDLMPTISSENKDKLYVSVERARQMGRIVSIPFHSGKTTLGNADAEKLKKEILAPELQKLLQDPTAVFVVLGFADTKGDEKANLRVSQDRADNTLRVLKEKCGVANVMHAVAMGGSTLFDEKGLEKNRTSEVWVVLP